MPSELNPNQMEALEDLRMVAILQKCLLFCILFNMVAYLCVVLFGSQLAEELAWVAVLAALLFFVVALAASVFTCLLAVRFYGTVGGIFLGLLTLIPCVGLLVLLTVNGKATHQLKSQGVKVGLLGARMSDIGKGQSVSQ